MLIQAIDQKSTFVSIKKWIMRNIKKKSVNTNPSFDCPVSALSLASISLSWLYLFIFRWPLLFCKLVFPYNDVDANAVGVLSLVGWFDW